MTVTEETCSSVTISWTLEDNRTAHFLILYNSTVHNVTVNYTSDVSPPYTTKLTDLVADTEYNITVSAKYNDDSTVSNTINARTKAGTPSGKGTGSTSNCAFYIHTYIIVNVRSCKQITKNLVSMYCPFIAISMTFNGSTSLSFNVHNGNRPYDCWINSTDRRLHRWTQRSPTTVTGLHPGTYYNITCQKRPTSGQECKITHTVVTTSKCYTHSILHLCRLSFKT